MSEVKPIYLYRRKGQPAWATCDAERYDELRGPLGDRLFDTRTAYSASDYDALEAELKKVKADRAACWAEFKVMTRACLDAEAERDAALAELALVRDQVESRGRALVGLEQIKDAEIDQLRAELAALKGGQVASGKLQWPEIVGLVNEVLGCEAHKFPCSRGSIGHEMAGINFNSLARIIDLVRHRYPAPPAQANWRDHSVNIAKGEKCPQNIETLQAAWDRDQELLLEQRAEIAKLKEKLNQARQKQPAQASTWVPLSESLPADRRDVMLYCADTKEHFVGFSKGGGLFQFAQDGNGLSIVCRPSHWRYIEDRDAPTPGASDGKGGDHE